jgi:hypothetical protein
MITVTYPDEPTPVSYRREIDRQILEYLKYLFGISIREAHEMARQIILRELDPIDVRGGEPFVFDGDVPDPYANVIDLLEAWDIAMREAQHCRYVLENEPSTEALLKVYRKTIAWLRFWSVRFPNAEWRVGFARMLEDREAALEELRSKALENGKLRMLEELNAI